MAEVPKKRIDDDGVMKMVGREEVMNKMQTRLLVQYADDIMFLIRRKTVKAAISGVYDVLATYFLKSKLKLNSHFL